MAPSPEHDNEPKAPDKNDNKASDAVELRAGTDFLEDPLSASTRDQDSSVSGLNDNELKALLDEAINYKTPKDREGKSRIFKVLLQEAEEDERNARAASASGPQLARYYNTTAAAAARRHRNSAAGRREASASSSAAGSACARLTHGGSLQDLAQPDLYADGHGSVPATGAGRRSGGRRRHHPHHHHPVTGQRTVSVSARQREGGSLPSNVNAGATYDSARLFEDDDHPRPNNLGKIAKRTAVATDKAVTAIGVADKKNNNSSSASANTTDQPVRRSEKQPDKMVETSSELSPEAPSTESGRSPGSFSTTSAESTTERADYTVVDLGIQNEEESSNNTEMAAATSNNLAVDVEETRGLLARDARATSYSSTESRSPGDLHRFRYHQHDGEAGSGDGEKETGEHTSRKHHSDANYDQVKPHEYYNPLEGTLLSLGGSHHKMMIPRPNVKYTSRATLEVDGVSSGPASIATVDKAITFPQLHERESASGGTGAGSLQLNADYSSVRCIVDGGTGTGDSIQTTSVRQQITAASAPQTASIAATQYRLLSVGNPKIIHGVDRYQHHADKKALDENGNSVSTTTSTSSLLDAKKKKKCKVDRNVTVLNSEEVAGHRADIIESIDLLVKYIEEDDTSSNSKTKHSHHHHHHHRGSGVTGGNVKNQQFQQNNANNTSNKHSVHIEGKKRARGKTKSDSSTSAVVKKSNSLEEISKTKLEDLMSSEDAGKCVRARVKKQSTSEDGDRRSWGTEDGQQYICSKREAAAAAVVAACDPDGSAVSVIMAETAEFHVVTKKKKSKKRTSSSGHQYGGSGAGGGHHAGAQAYGGGRSGDQYQYQRIERDKASMGASPASGGLSEREPAHQARSYHRHTFNSADSEHLVPARRKSACSVPPSDKSADSSDVDSVHSLPAATVHRCEDNSSGGNVSAGGYQQFTAATSPSSSTSYADIARTNGGSVQSSSSASSNCSSYSSSQPGQQQSQLNSAWKTSPNQQQPPSNSAVAVPLPLRSEHFPELCDSTSVGDVIHRPNDFPSLDQQQQPQQQRSAAVVTGPRQNNREPATSPSAVPAPQLQQQQQRVVVAKTQPDSKSCDSSASAARTVVASANANAAPAVNFRRRGATSRPAVIILDDETNGETLTPSSDPIQVSGLTFGFELNEQLLNSASGYLDGDIAPVTAPALAPFALPVATDKCETSCPIGATAAVGDVFSARFIAPLASTAYNHDKIVTFVGLAWEDVMLQTNGKVQYYNGQ